MTMDKIRSFLSRDHTGYTVVEILVALSLTGLVLGVLYGSYSTVVGSTRNYRRVSDTYQSARVVLTNLGRELTGAYQPAMIEERLMFQGKEEWFQGRRLDRLSFVTTTSARGAEEETGYDAFELSYFAGYGNQEGLLLARRAPFFNPEEPFEAGEERIIAENLRSLAFEFYDGLEWKEEWNPEEEKRLPLAVRITIGLGESEEAEPNYFSTAVYLPLAQPLTAEEKEVPAAEIPSS